MYASSNQSAATALFAVTPSDATNFATRARGVYVGVGGNISFVDGKGTAVLLSNVPTGAFINAECLRINAAGTTATNMVGFV